MDSVAVTVPLRPPTKKMKKRKELDALAPPHAVSRRSSGKRSSQELLTDSSDERSEYWNVSMRNGRKCRGRRNRACPGLLKACGAFLACASVLVTACLIWLFIDVRQQLTALRTELDQVIAGSEGVPDALQKCHSLSKKLQDDQNVLFGQVSDFKQQVYNFSAQMTNLQHGLHQVQEWFQAAPELATVPKDLSDLRTSVASLGSKIQDLDATLKMLKDTNSKVQVTQTGIQQNITSIQNSMSELSNITQKSQTPTINESTAKTDELNAAISSLANNLTRVNQTLSQRIQWATEEQTKDHNMLISLTDKMENVSTIVISLQTKFNIKMLEQTTLASSVEKLTNEVKDLETTKVDVNNRVKFVEETCNNIKNSTNSLLTIVKTIQAEHEPLKLNNENNLTLSPVIGTTESTVTDDNSQKKAPVKPQNLSVG